MMGSRYWSTGITVRYLADPDGRTGWGASLEFLDDGFADDDADKGRISTEGTLRTRYLVRNGEHADALTTVIDVLKADAERLGFEWCTPRIYGFRDGLDPDWPMPDCWRGLLTAQALRIGWGDVPDTPHASRDLDVVDYSHFCGHGHAHGPENCGSCDSPACSGGAS